MEKFMARGPAYPYVNLEAAISLIQKMYDYTKRSPAQVDAVLRDAWKYSPTSSSSLKILAALKYFGLIEEVQSKGSESKSIKITDRSLRILIDAADSIDRQKALRDAALSPRWYKFCWDTWGADMPQSMRSTLIFDHNFIETTVDAFIRDYKKTIAYAGITEVQNITQEEDQSANEQLKEVDEFLNSQSKDLNSVSNSGDRGLKLSLGERQPEVQRHFLHKLRDQGMKQEISTLDEGDVTITWPAVLSEHSYQDLVDWMELLKRKIHRSVISNKSNLQNPNNDDD
jgi:hypothetical protein